MAGLSLAIYNQPPDEPLEFDYHADDDVHCAALEVESHDLALWLSKGRYTLVVYASPVGLSLVLHDRDGTRVLMWDATEQECNAC